MVSLSRMRTPHVQTGSPGLRQDFCCSVVGNLATSGCRRSIGLGFDPLGPVPVSVVSIVIADVRVWGHMASLEELPVGGRSGAGYASRVNPTTVDMQARKPSSKLLPDGGFFTPNRSDGDIPQTDVAETSVSKSSPTLR